MQTAEPTWTITRRVVSITTSGRRVMKKGDRVSPTGISWEAGDVYVLPHAPWYFVCVPADAVEQG